MAEKKYIDLTGLTHYDEKIKALIDSKDATALQAAKDYSDGLAGNYDAVGTAETKVNELANGQVKANKDAIAKLNGTAETEGSVAKAVADAKSALETKITAVDGKADAAKDTASAAQGDVDKLETYVGVIPTSATAQNVVAYVDEKTTNIASGTEFANLKTRVSTAEGNITTLQSDVDAVEAKAAANEAAITKLNGEGDGSVKKQIDAAFNDFATKVSDDNVVNTYKELIDYCATHSAEAAEMAGNIAKNATAISDLEKFVGTLPEGTQAKDVIAYINEKVAAEQTRATKAEGDLGTRLTAIEGKFSEGDGSVAEQIKAAVKTETDARTAADKTLEGKITTAQNKADANATAIEELKTDKASQSDLDAVSGRVTTAEGKIKTLEGASHTHANSDVLDAITAGDVANWNSAHTKEHEHANKAVLDGISAAKVSAWDAAEQNAKTYADGLVAEFTPITNTEIDKLFGVTQE